MKKKSILLWTLSLGLLVGFSACSSNNSNENTSGNSDAPAEEFDISGQASVEDDVSAKNIVQIAVGSPDHTTLVAGVKAAGLVDVLANNGPFTVFAPTNAGFDKLPEGVLDDLLKPENKSKLIQVIYYHAAAIVLKGDRLKDGMKIDMATGDDVTITREGDDVFANGSKILATIEATNGVIHVVDDVLLAPAK